MEGENLEMNQAIMEKEVEKAIEEIKNGKAPDPEGIINEMVKNGK